MLDKVKAFWEYVVHRQEPEDVYLRTSQAIKDAIKIDGKTKRDVSKSNSFTTHCNTYLENEEAYEKFINAKKYLNSSWKKEENLY